MIPPPEDFSLPWTSWSSSERVYLKEGVPQYWL